MNAKELKRYLARLGCTFQNHRGGSGHQTVYLNGKKSQLPMHGGSKELGPALVHKIKKQLGIEE
jgi:mRNA interferase HicA